MIGFEAETTRALKALPEIDRRLAYHSFSEGVSACMNYYPARGGVGLWVEVLEKSLRDQGVQLLTGRSVVKVLQSEATVEGVILDDGQKLPADLVVWTVPVVHWLRAAGIDFQASVPDRLDVHLQHLTFDQPFETDLHYLTCYDDDVLPFRVTLYPNLLGDAANRAKTFHLTVETLSRGDGDLQLLSQTVKRDLVSMGIVSKTAQVVHEFQHTLMGAVPLITPAFRAEARALLELASERTRNVLFLGKSRGTSFFMNDVLAETYEAVTERLDTSRLAQSAICRNIS